MQNICDFVRSFVRKVIVSADFLQKYRHKWMVKSAGTTDFKSVDSMIRAPVSNGLPNFVHFDFSIQFDF